MKRYANGVGHTASMPSACEQRPRLGELRVLLELHVVDEQRAAAVHDLVLHERVQALVAPVRAHVVEVLRDRGGGRRAR